MDGAEGEWTMILPLAFLLISGSPQSAIVVESFEQPEEFRLGGVQIHPDSQLRLSEKDAFEGKRCAELRYKFEQVSGLQYLEVIAPHKLTEKPPQNQRRRPRRWFWQYRPHEVR